MRAFNQAGNVGEDELLRHRQADDAELGMQGCERVVGDLRPSGGDDGEKGGFTGVGQTDQTGIGDQLQAQPDPELLPRHPFLAFWGARLVEVLKRALPKPPSPPFSSVMRLPGVSRSASKVS